MARRDPHSARTIGVLSVAYAVALMIGGVAANMVFLMPSILIELQLRHQRAEEERAFNLRLQAQKYEEEEKAATDEKARDSIREKKEMAQAEAETAEGGKLDAELGELLVSRNGLRSPSYLLHFVADLASNLALNFLMLASGVGLLLSKRWGRSLGLAVAWMKIARLLTLALSMTFVVAPLVASLIASGEAAMPVEGASSIATPVHAILVGSAWCVAVLGSIYPIATILVLRRPAVAAAVSGRG